jgi:tetratricopeptide (TPR) repeat protein
MNQWSDAERRVEKAQEFYEQRKWSEALREIRVATSINPYNSSWFFDTGLILDEMGHYAEALEAYRQADEIESNDIQTLNHIGLDLFRIGKVGESIEIFEKIEKIDSSFEPCYCNRITAYAHLGDHQRAEEVFYTARLQNETCPQCFYNIAASLEARGLYDKAIYCWTHALQLEFGQPDVNWRIAHAHWKKGDLHQARRFFLDDLRLNPGRTQTLLDLGQLLVKMGRHEDAVEKFRRALEQSPGDPGGYYHLARLLAKRGSDADAEALFLTALRIDPTLAGPHLGLGQIFLRRGAISTAREQALAELQLRSCQDQISLQLANLLMDLNEFALAADCLRLLVGSRPELTIAWINLAVAQFAFGQYTEGIESSLTALRLEPTSPIAAFNVALGYEHLKDYSTALVWIRNARQNGGNDPSFQRLEIRLRVFYAASKLVFWFNSLW